MAHNVVMPRLGLTMEEGSVVSWRKQLGDRIEEGEVLFTVETDKVEMEVESGDTGYLSAIHVQLGEKVPVGTLIATLSDHPAEAANPSESPALTSHLMHDRATDVSRCRRADAFSTSSSMGAHRSEAPASARVVASPRARSLAKALGIDIAAVKPARGQRVVEEDVRRFQAIRDAASPPPVESSAPSSRAFEEKALPPGHKVPPA